jgi:hypothetical protein
MIGVRRELGSQPARRVLQRPFVKLSLFVNAALLSLASFLTADHAALAAPINYGSHVGTTVSYIDVTEDSTTSDPTPLFGAPVFSADSIDFNPIGFDAHAMGAGGNDVTGARLTFRVEANSGFAVRNINFSEAGDTTLAGAGTDATATAVTATGTMTISEVDGAAITPLVRPIALTFTPSGGGYGLATDGLGSSIFSQQWTGALFVDISQVLTQEGVPFTFGATNISFDLVNTLTASSESGTSSVINKHDFGGISITVNIPEPATVMLVAMGMAAMLLAGRWERKGS